MNKMKILTKKTPNSKLVILSEYQNTKTSLRKDTTKIAQKKFLSLATMKYHKNVFSASQDIAST